MRLLIINGPNINMLGKRNPNIYGPKTYKQIVKEQKMFAKANKIKIKIKQSNYEGKIIKWIQKASKYADGVIINAAAYSHYSYAIRDALELLDCKKIEIHISNTQLREEFRKTDLLEPVVDLQIVGKGTEGYIEAINFFVKR